MAKKDSSAAAASTVAEEPPKAAATVAAAVKVEPPAAAKEDLVELHYCSQGGTERTVRARVTGRRGQTRDVTCDAPKVALQGVPQGPRQQLPWWQPLRG